MSENSGPSGLRPSDKAVGCIANSRKVRGSHWIQPRLSPAHSIAGSLGMRITAYPWAAAQWLADTAKVKTKAALYSASSLLG